MQLLVSVRTAAEVGPALAGGADIIDAKEPDRGSLGAVAPQTLARIIECVPPNRTLSVAMGDIGCGTDLAAAIASITIPGRLAPTFLKLGFAGVRSPELLKQLLATALELAAEQQSAPLLIAVSYADAARARSLPPEVIRRLADEAGVAGVLLDTYVKDGAGLLRWLDLGLLEQWISAARTAGLLTAVAGGLGLEDVEPIAGVGPDILGVRGAACDGGRSGGVSALRVRELCQRMGRSPSGETRDQGADPAWGRWSKSLKNNA